MRENFLISLLLTAAAFFLPVAPLLMIAISAILLDTLFGIISSVKMKKPLLSRKLQRICVKLLIYLPLILLAFPIDLYILDTFTQQIFETPLFLTKVVTVIIVGIELFSVDEKVRAFNQEKGFAHYFLKIVNVIRETRKKLSSIIEDPRNQ
jgi:hypothetical protein